MRILSYYTELPGCCPLTQLRLIARWAEAWRLVGLEPFVATDHHLMPLAQSEPLLEALEAPAKGLDEAVQRLGCTQYLLRDGETALMAHYDCFPGENPWALPTDLSRAWWAGPLWFGVKEQMELLTACEMPGVFVHRNTPELRAEIGIKPVQWYADKIAPPPPTGQFGRQFAPKVRVV